MRRRLVSRMAGQQISNDAEFNKGDLAIPMSHGLPHERFKMTSTLSHEAP
jgi:hypothetical protein